MLPITMQSNGNLHIRIIAISIMTCLIFILHVKHSNIDLAVDDLLDLDLDVDMNKIDKNKYRHEGEGDYEGENIMTGRGSGAHNNFHIIPTDHHPTLEDSDLVYNLHRNTVPVVNEEYNLIFFLTAKAASSEWIRFLMRLQGSDNWCAPTVHDKEVNGLKFLTDYSKEEAQEMMTSLKWNRAIFVRNPKPRILSAFLDKAVQHEKHFMRSNCPLWAEWTAERGGTLQECIERHDSFEFFLYNITTTLNKNVHWRSIYSRIDDKWWPYVNYIAHMKDLSADAEDFLTSIHSNIDGVSAWDRIGKTGWSDNERDCDHLGTDAFLSKKDNQHHTNARDKMLQYYTPKLERFVETHFADDYNNPFFHFSEVKLYPDGDGENESSDAE